MCGAVWPMQEKGMITKKVLKPVSYTHLDVYKRQL